MPDEISTRVALTGEKEYRDELKAIAEAQKVLSSETAKTTAAFDKNDKSVEALTARNGQLEKSLELQRQKVEACRKGLENASKAWGEVDARTQKWKKELNYAEAQVIKTESAVRANTEAITALNRAADSKALKNFAEGAKAAGESLDKMGNKLTMGLTVPLVAAGTAASNYASDTVESIGKVEVAFGYAAEGVKNWSDSTLTSIGLAKGTALDMAALYGDMATSMGFAQATAADMSKTLVGLGADLASYKNISIDVANTALKAIFTGETESLKGLGVVMTQANLQAYAMAQGFKTAYKDMDQTQQVAVRYQYVLAQTANAQGDFARTSDNTANQLRILQESLKEAAALAGDQLLPIITPIVTRLSELVQRFGQLDDGTRKAIVQTALFVATLGPMLKLTGGVAAAVSAGVAAFKALTVAKGADVIVTGAQTAATTAATTAQTGLNVAMNANPIGAVATAIGMLVAALASFITVTELTAEKAEDFNAALRRTVSETERTVESIEKDTASKLANLEAVKRLLPEIDALNSKNGRTSAEQSKLNALVETANNLYPNLIGSVNALTGSYALNTTSIQDNIEATKAQLRAQAAYDVAAEKYAAAAKLRADMAAAEEEFRSLEAQRREAANNAIMLGDNGAWWAQKARELDAQIAKIKETAVGLTQQIRDYEAEADGIIDTATGVGKATEGMGESTQSASDAMSAAMEATATTAEGLTKSTRALISEAETLSSAFAEQAENGNLSADTTLKLIEAGYGAALAIDEETGAVRLNAEAYATLARQKIDEQIAGIQDSQRETKARLLQAEGDAALAAAMGHTALALSYQESAKAIQGEMVNEEAMIAQLKALRDGLGSVVTGNYSSKARATPKSSSKKEKSAADRELEAYQDATKELDHRRAMDLITEKDYYAEKSKLGDAHLKNNLDERRKLAEELHQWQKNGYDRELSALDESLANQEISLSQHTEGLKALQVQYLTEGTKAWRENDAQQAANKMTAYENELADLKYFRDLSLISEQRYYADLARLRDKHLEEDSEEWRRVTVELHQWQQKQREATLKAEKEAYEAYQKRRADLVKQYTEQRIAAIKAEQKAEEDRLNALIDGIDEEIAARKRLRQVESDDDAVTKAQKVLEAAQFQISFARDENTRRELEKEVTRAQQALDKALQSKADNDFYYAKEQEKDALRDQLGDVREKYQKQIDGAPAWAEQRVSEYEAAQERRARAEEEAQRKDQEKWEREQATMQTIQKAATGALAAAGKVVTQITNAVTKVTNNNSATINTGSSAMTSGQLARTAAKVLEQMAKA